MIPVKEVHNLLKHPVSKKALTIGEIGEIKRHLKDTVAVRYETILSSNAQFAIEKILREKFVELKITTGGAQGGNCWGDSANEFYSGEQFDDKRISEDFVKENPNATARQLLDYLGNYFEYTYSDVEYYGNYTDYTVRLYQRCLPKS